MLAFNVDLTGKILT